LAIVTTAAAYLQLLLGAQLRHRDAAGDPIRFRLMVMLHLFMAAVVAAHALMLTLRARRLSNVPWLARPAFALTALVGLQLLLGGSTWVVKYGWPIWFAQYSWAQAHVNTSESLPQVIISTGHVATGSLILAVASLTAVRAARAASTASITAPRSALALEAAR
jgi:cytochrome c oxidase assembly protein subunit 15